MKNTLLLVANASRARLFELSKARIFQNTKGNHLLTLQNEFEHHTSRKKGRDLLTDSPYGKFGSGAFGEDKDVKHHEAEQFAIILAHKLDDCRKKDQERDFIIAAPPAFLGLLKDHLTNLIEKKAIYIQKDYTLHNEKELVDDLKDNL